jgi:hypothetical protein
MLLHRFIDRLPLLPTWGLLTLAAIMGINGLLGLTVDAWDVPAWVGLGLLATVMAFGWKAARVEQQKAERRVDGSA